MAWVKLGESGRVSVWADGSRRQVRLRRDGQPAVRAEVLDPELVAELLAGAVGMTHRVATAAEFAAASRLAEPGDTVLVTADPHQRLYWDGTAGARSGVPGRHITVTTAPGVVLTGAKDSGTALLDLYRVSHVDVVGVTGRTSSFGVRAMALVGTAASPCRLERLHLSDLASVGVLIARPYGEPGPSAHVHLSRSTVLDVGGEAVYIGTGDPAWVDETHDVTVSGCTISEGRREAVDIKPGTRRVTVEGCEISRMAPLDSAAIVCNLSWVQDHPRPGEHAGHVIRRNRISDHNPGRDPQANDIGIWLGGGGVLCEANEIDGVRPDGRGGKAISVWANGHDMGPAVNVVQNNVCRSAPIWVAPELVGATRLAGNVTP
jgi:hypothetical protein